MVIILSHGWDLSFAAVDSTESTLLSIDRFCSKLEEDQTLDGAHFKQEIFLLQQNLQNNQSELVRVTSEENPFSQGLKFIKTPNSSSHVHAQITPFTSKSWGGVIIPYIRQGCFVQKNSKDDKCKAMINILTIF